MCNFYLGISIIFVFFWKKNSFLLKIMIIRKKYQKSKKIKNNLQ